MVRIGLPAGIQGSLFSISNVMVQSAINSFNSDALISGNGSAASIEGFVYVIMNSFHQTAVNYVGQNTGAHRFDRIKKIFALCLGYVAVFGLVAGSAVWFFGRELLSIYITDSPEAIAYGLIRFQYVALPYFLCGLMDVSTGALRGLGSSFTSMAISVLCICGIRIVWIQTVFQIPQFHTPESLYTSYLVTWVLAFLVQAFAFMTIYKKKAQLDKIMTETIND